jgi:hypothetical protein
MKGVGLVGLVTSRQQIAFAQALDWVKQNTHTYPLWEYHRQQELRVSAISGIRAVSKVSCPMKEKIKMGIPLTQVGPISSMQGWRQKSIRGM